MLSFMKDQGLEELQPQNGENGADEQQDQQYLTVAVKEKNVRKSTWTLAILFVVGMAGLLMMIKKSTPQSTQAGDIDVAEAQIETAIERLTGIRSEVFGRMDEVVTKFHEFSNVEQIQVDELLKNPFYYDMFKGQKTKAEKVKPVDPEKEARALRAKILRKEAGDLQLLSIMESPKGNCCMINDAILYEGDTIKGFKVGEIGDGFVKLICEQVETENIEIILKLGQ
jgi:preprotein translocase subunit SecG